MPIPIVDLFAGPGGLGEGFSSCSDSVDPRFSIVLSIEKDPVAHKTLKLRSFTRQFKKDIPEAYYDYVRKDKAEIAEFLYNSKFKKQLKAAESEALNLTLGPDNKAIEGLIKERIGNRSDWVLIGGPPCQAYSLVGRSRMNKKDGFELDERHTLYENYLHMLAKFKPAVFVMENVKGMLSSKVDGEPVFERIMNDLACPSQVSNKSKKPAKHYDIYSFVVGSENPAELKPSDFVIRSELYGIPQKRHRVILLGIRTDKATGLDPTLLLKTNNTITTHDAIGDLPKLRSRLSRKKSDGGDSYKDWVGNLNNISTKINHSNISFHPSALNETLESINNNNELEIGGRFTKVRKKRHKSKHLKENWNWYHDESIGGVLNHQSRAHMPSDLQRYLYCSVFAKHYNRPAKLGDFPEFLLPNHKNVDQGRKGLFSDRFRVQLKNEPSTTITSHISKDGHYYIHYDPEQCRSFSVREAARLQTFPDNYFFEGNVTQQYHQVGNAVPPLLARQLAHTVFGIMKNRNQA